MAHSQGSVWGTMRALLLLPALLACRAPARDGAASALARVEADSSIQVWFTDPDARAGTPALATALGALIDSTSQTLDVALYDLDDGDIVDALLDAHDRGVDLRVVGDEDEAEGMEPLIDAGIAVELRPASSRIMHHKFMIADGETVWTGSTNLTETGLTMNNNNAVQLRDQDLAEAYGLEFEQMFAGDFGTHKEGATELADVRVGSTRVEVIFSPQDQPAEALIELIDSAEHSLRFMVFSFTRDDVVEALVAAKDRGVDVAGIMDESQASSRYAVDEDLAMAGIPVALDGNHNTSGWAGGKLHHKVLIVDAGTRAARGSTGSANWSTSANTANDENMLIIHSAGLTDEFESEFCTLWEVAEPLAGSPEADPCAEGAGEDRSSTKDKRATVIINEVLVDPDDSPSPMGAFIELVNHGEAAISLSGWTLVGDRELHRFEGTTLAPGGVLVIHGVAVGGLAGSIQATGGALDFGDALSLHDASGTQVDTARLADAPVGESLNRATDGERRSWLIPHLQVEGALGPDSPGQRADGGSWAQ